MIAASGRSRTTEWVAIAYLILFPFNWPTLSSNARLVDLLIIPLALLVWHNRDGLRPIRFTALDWCVVAYVLSALPSFAATDNVRLSGVAFAKHVYLAAVFTVFATYFRQNGATAPLRVFACAAACVAAVSVAAGAIFVSTGVELPGLGQKLGLPYIGTVLRVWGGTETAEMFGNELTFACPLLLALAGPLSLRHPWPLCATLAIILAMGMTFSHAVAGFVTALGIFAWQSGSLRSRGLLAAVVTLVALVILLTNAVLVAAIREVKWSRDHNAAIPPPAYHYGFQPPEGADRLSVSVSFNPMSYWLIKEVAFEAFVNHPLTGIGLGRFHVATARAQAQGRLQLAYREIDPHSTILGALAETGVWSGAAIVALFVTALVRANHIGGMAHGDDAVIRGVTAALVGLAVNSINTDVMNFRFLWIGFAALRAVI